MDIVLSHWSALEFWSAMRVCDDSALQAHPSARKELLSIDRGAQPCWEGRRLPTSELVDRVAQLCPVPLSAPLHGLVPPKTSRRPSAGCGYHQVRVPLPEGSAVHVREGLWVCSPECALVQVASPDRITLGWLLSEFASVYGRATNGEMYAARPVVDRETLEVYLARAAKEGVRGVRWVRAALPCMVARAASPRELAWALRMSLPRAQGGWGIPRPELNYAIPMDRRVRSAFGRRGFSVDMCWPDRALCLEYDSDRYHLDSRRRALDNDRRAVLEAMGWQVIPFSTKQYDSLAMADETCRRILVYLGLRDRTGEKQYDWQARRSELLIRLNRLADFGIAGLACPAR